jgi:hypothetical protein
LTYTEDRETFEAQFFRPPFLARMLEASGKYTDGLDCKDAFLQTALDRFWELRGKIDSAQGVMNRWHEALEYAAKTRPRWLVHYGSALERTKWVRSARLGRD